MKIASKSHGIVNKMKHLNGIKRRVEREKTKTKYKKTQSEVGGCWGCWFVIWAQSEPLLNGMMMMMLNGNDAVGCLCCLWFLCSPKLHFRR